MASRSILDDLPFCLARTSLAFRRFNDQTLRAVGLPVQAPGVATVLHALHEQSDCTVNQLVEKTTLANGTLTGLLDTLEDDGLIRRLPNPADGRSWIIRLTAKGETVCEKLDERHRLVMKHFSAGMTEHERGELTRLLALATEQMRKLADIAPPRPAAKRSNAGLSTGSKVKKVKLSAGAARA